MKQIILTLSIVLFAGVTFASNHKPEHKNVTCQTNANMDRNSALHRQLLNEKRQEALQQTRKVNSNSKVTN